MFCFIFTLAVQKSLYVRKIATSKKERVRNERKKKLNLINNHGHQHITHYQIRLLAIRSGPLEARWAKWLCISLSLSVYICTTQCSVSKLSWEYAAGVRIEKKNSNNKQYTHTNTSTGAHTRRDRSMTRGLRASFIGYVRAHTTFQINNGAIGMQNNTPIDLAFFKVNNTIPVDKVSLCAYARSFHALSLHRNCSIYVMAFLFRFFIKIFMCIEIAGPCIDCMHFSKASICNRPI